MFQFIETGLRGGISYIPHRYSKANNKYMKTYDENAPSKYIMYLEIVIIYMVIACVGIYQLVISNGWQKNRLLI